MSNDLVFANAQLPAHLRAAAEAHTEFDSMGGAIIPKIQVRVTGIQIVEGETVLAEVPAGSSIPVVVVGAGPVSRSYYKGKYQKGESSVPDCRSYDGLKPDANVEEPMASRCDACPMNAKGSSTESAGGRACRFRQNLAVISPAMPDKLLRLPIASTSIFPKDDYDGYAAFRPYVAKLRGNKLQPFHVVTDVRQHPKSEQTHTVFQAVGYVDEATLNRALAHREDTEALDVIYGKFEQAVAHDAAEEERKDAEAFDRLHGAPPAHVTESRNPTSAEVVKKAEPVLGYTAFEPQEVDVVVTYWRGITVTRNIGGKTIGVVIEVPAGQALPDEEWEEATAADYTAYTAEVQAAEATQQVPPKRSRTRTAAAVEEPAPETPPKRARKSTPATATGAEAGQATTTSDQALANAIDTMFDDEDEDDE